MTVQCRISGLRWRGPTTDGQRKPSHAELVQAWPARTAPGAAELARGWWQPTIEVLQEERRRAASLERARATRRAKAS